MQAIEKYFGGQVEVIFVKGGLSLLLACNCDKKEEELVELADTVGIRIKTVAEYYLRHMEYHQKGRPKVYLSFKGIVIEEIEPIVKLLNEVWFRKE